MQAAAGPGAYPAAHHAPARPDPPATRRRPGGRADDVAGWFRRRLHSAQRLDERRPFLAPQQRRVVPFREVAADLRQGLRAWRCATWRGHSPAVSGQTGSIGGSRSGRSAGTTCSGCDMVSRPLNCSSLPETSSFAARRHLPFAARIWKNTNSAKPVPSLTTTRQGWRGLAGGSWRTTSTASVAISPGFAGAMVGRGRRSRYDFGQVKQQIDHPIAAGRLGDQRRNRRDRCLSAWSAARTEGREDRGPRADMG